MRPFFYLVLMLAGCHFEVSGVDSSQGPDDLAVSPSCSDGEKNGDETDIDCGGATCPACPMPPSCTNGVKDGTETDVDCGGACTHCANGKACKVGIDCSSAICGSAGTCRDPRTCKEFHTALGNPADGVFMINPGGAGTPFSAFCDMTSDGGGWTLMATLQGSSVQPPAPLYNPLTDDWWATSHGNATSPNNAFTNIDARKLKPLVAAGTILRATNSANAVRRYHFGFTAADWDLWNAGRTVATVIIVGPFELSNVLVSRNVDLSNAVQARVNGGWNQGYFYLGSMVAGGDTDGEGIGARYQIGTSSSGVPGYVGEARGSTLWSLWVREP